MTVQKWPEEWTDPKTGERMTTMGKYRSGPHPKPLGCYEYDENAELVCWKCQWRGAAREGSREDYEELFDISCPRCDTMLLIVSTVVTNEEVEVAAAAAGIRRHRLRSRKSESGRLKRLPSRARGRSSRPSPAR
jgi:hypothetical protein